MSIDTTSFPLLLLICLDPLRMMEERRRKRARIEKFRAVRARWPFVSMPELYFYKRYADPKFKKPYTAKTLHKLRIEHEKERKRCLRGHRDSII